MYVEAVRKKMDPIAINVGVKGGYPLPTTRQAIKVHQVQMKIASGLDFIKVKVFFTADTNTHQSIISIGINTLLNIYAFLIVKYQSYLNL